MDQKILMLGWGFPPKIDGGLDIHVAHLFEELRRKGVDIELALPAERAPNIPRIKSIEVSSEGMIPMARDMSREVVKLAEDYDIVHTHDWFGAEAGFKAQEYADTKWVATFHSLHSDRTRNPGREISMMERAAAERADKVIAVSRLLADSVQDEFGTNPEIIHNGFSKPGSNGVDMKEDLDIEDNMIFFVGRHAEQKGIEHLIYGFSKFLESNDAVLVVGGDGHLRDSLETFVELLGIQDNVIFTGFIPDEELGDYYRSADVFVSPSINEPFGLTVTEALESGTQVVATTNGAEEVLPDGVITRVEPSSESIKNGLEEALARKVPPKFSSRGWEEVAGETLNVYESLSE